MALKLLQTMSDNFKSGRLCGPDRKMCRSGIIIIKDWLPILSNQYPPSISSMERQYFDNVQIQQPSLESIIGRDVNYSNLNSDDKDTKDTIGIIGISQMTGLSEVVTDFWVLLTTSMANFFSCIPRLQIRHCAPTIIPRPVILQEFQTHLCSFRPGQRSSVRIYFRMVV